MLHACTERRFTALKLEKTAEVPSARTDAPELEYTSVDFWPNLWRTSPMNAGRSNLRPCEPCRLDRSGTWPIHARRWGEMGLEAMAAGRTEGSVLVQAAIRRRTAVDRYPPQASSSEEMRASRAFVANMYEKTRATLKCWSCQTHVTDPLPTVGDAVPVVLVRTVHTTSGKLRCWRRAIGFPPPARFYR